jgi:hypothetical protein
MRDRGGELCSGPGDIMSNQMFLKLGGESPYAITGPFVTAAAPLENGRRANRFGDSDDPQNPPSTFAMRISAAL